EDALTTGRQVPQVQPGPGVRAAGVHHSLAVGRQGRPESSVRCGRELHDLPRLPVEAVNVPQTVRHVRRVGEVGLAAGQVDVAADGARDRARRRVDLVPRAALDAAAAVAIEPQGLY